MEYNSDDELETEYFYSGSRLIAIYTENFGYNFVYQDHLGSTRRLSASVMLRDYYPYSETYEAAGDATDVQFSQKELDNNTGLYYFETAVCLFPGTKMGFNFGFILI